MISVSSQNSVKAYCNTNRGSLVAISYQDFHAIIEEKIYEILQATLNKYSQNTLNAKRPSYATSTLTPSFDARPKHILNLPNSFSDDDEAKSKK